MDIIFKDSEGVNLYMLKSNGVEYELFRKAEPGTKKNGAVVKNEWITMKHYFYTLPAGVYAALDLCLKDSPSKHEVVAEKARIALGKILHDEVEKIVVEVSK